MDPPDDRPLPLRTSHSQTSVSQQISVSSSPRHNRRKSLREALTGPLSRGRSSSMPDPTMALTRATLSRTHVDVRILVLGDADTGKTTLCYRWHRGNGPQEGEEKKDSLSRAIRQPDVMQVVELRDCSNAEPFFADKTLLPVFDAFIILYSVDSFPSYMKAGTLYERLQKQLSGATPPVCLFVATKTDLPQREVGKEYGQELGARHGVTHKEISATGDLSVLEELIADVAAQVGVQRKNLKVKELFDPKKEKKKSLSPAPSSDSISSKKEHCIVM